MPNITVFIENEAGTDLKHHYDEATFEVLRTEHVGADYPYPYGFVPGTLAPDGDAADCFVVTTEAVPTATRLECTPVALIEQTEGGLTDHNVIAVPAGQDVPDLVEVQARIGFFVARFMPGVIERESVMGRLLPASAATAYVNECRAAAGTQ